MLSMVRAQMYRIAKSRSIWAVCLIIALFVLATPLRPLAVPDMAGVR